MLASTSQPTTSTAAAAIVGPGATRTAGGHGASRFTAETDCDQGGALPPPGCALEAGTTDPSRVSSSRTGTTTNAKKGGQKKCKNKSGSGSGSPSFTKFLSSFLHKALGSSHGKSSSLASPSSVSRDGQPTSLPSTGFPAHDDFHPQPSIAPPQYAQKPLAALNSALVDTIHLPDLFTAAGQAFDAAATRLIACDEPVPDDQADATPASASTSSTRLWHTLALHLRATFPPAARHLLQPVLTPVELVPYLASLLAELALDVCQTLVPGGNLASDQAHALRVYGMVDTDEHVRQTLHTLVADLLLTLATIHPHPLPVDADDRQALYAACVLATKALAGMRALHPLINLYTPELHAPIPLSCSDSGTATPVVVWVGLDVSKDVLPGGRKAVDDANRVAYVVFPGVSLPPEGVVLPTNLVPRAVVAAYHDPKAYLAGRKRDLYAAAMAAKAAAARDGAGDKVAPTDLEQAMMRHWHELQRECDDENELDKQRRRADEELILANAYGAQMTLFMVDGMVDG